MSRRIPGHEMRDAGHHEHHRQPDGDRRGQLST